MRRWGMIVVSVSILAGAAGIVAAHEGEGESHSQHFEAFRAIKEKYHARKQQLREEYKQKMEAVDTEERNEIQTAMNTAHEQRMKHKEEHYQKHQQEMNKHWDERAQRKQEKRETP